MEATRANNAARIVGGHARWHRAGMEIRDAVPDDAPSACLVLRRSIQELCESDHHGDEAILTRWLSNKTPEIVGSWIGRPAHPMLVAVEDDRILGVGSVNEAGTITLNYVSPDARFRGVSKAMIAALESRALAFGAVQCTLVSTETARRFYHATGYVEDGKPVGETRTGAGYSIFKPIGPVAVRRATEPDLDALVRLNAVVQQLHAALEPGFFKAEINEIEVATFFREKLALPGHTIFLADYEGHSSGYIWFERQERPETCLTRPARQIHVHHIAVDTSVQRRGVASALLRVVEAEALASGINRIVLGAWAANHSAHAFFTAHGFAAFSLMLGKRVG